MSGQGIVIAYGRGLTAEEARPQLAGAMALLLAGAGPMEVTAVRISDRARAVSERLSVHLARLLGEAGTRALFTRSLSLARSRFSWIAASAPGAGASEPPWAPLCRSMALQAPELSMAAYADFLSTFLQLLGKLLGDSLVSRLLQEIWPQVFLQAGKECT